MARMPKQPACEAVHMHRTHSPQSSQLRRLSQSGRSASLDWCRTNMNVKLFERCTMASIWNSRRLNASLTGGCGPGGSLLLRHGHVLLAVPRALKLHVGHATASLRGRTRRSLTSRFSSQHHDAEVFVEDMTSADPAWQLRAQKGNIRVWRRVQIGSPYNMVRSNALLNVKPSTIVALLDSSNETLIRQYNPLYLSGWDLERVDEETKVSYGRVRAVAPGFKPRDTVTRISRTRLRSGAIAFILRATEHPSMPPVPGVIRARIISGTYLPIPVKNEPQLTNFTFTIQARSRGCARCAIVLSVRDELRIDSFSSPPGFPVFAGLALPAQSNASPFFEPICILAPAPAPAHLPASRRLALPILIALVLSRHPELVGDHCLRLFSPRVAH
eukprot:1993781-Pleurochrysis_carterae.AAC.2